MSATISCEYCKWAVHGPITQAVAAARAHDDECPGPQAAAPRPLTVHPNSNTRRRPDRRTTMNKNRRPLTINQMSAAAYLQSSKSGFWEDHTDMHALIDTVTEDDRRKRLADSYDRTTTGEKLALFHSEVSETLEEVRAGHAPTETYYRADGKPEGVPSELADILIRVGDLAGAFGIDLEAAVIEKMGYNATRAYRHGKKF